MSQKGVNSRDNITLCTAEFLFGLGAELAERALQMIQSVQHRTKSRQTKFHSTDGHLLTISYYIEAFNLYREPAIGQVEFITVLYPEASALAEPAFRFCPGLFDRLVNCDAYLESCTV